jgi:predicted GNAT family acetyltransferase
MTDQPQAAPRIAPSLRWQKMKKRQKTNVEKLLRANERWCMNSCSRYLGGSDITVWLLGDKALSPAALIIHSKQHLLPVLCGQKTLPAPKFLCGIFGTAPIYSLQGRKEDVLTMETALEKIELYAAEKNDYDLMFLDQLPPDHHLTASANVPAGLVIRKPIPADMEELAALHASYEQEEVLPAAAEFNPAASRLNIERIFTNEQMLVAELGGHIIGKINTNATTFTRYQIGGVYVHPKYRGLGIGRRMAGEFTESLLTQGRGISLFVKKSNPAARRVYQRIGFEILGDYRICYY